MIDDSGIWVLLAVLLGYLIGRFSRPARDVSVTRIERKVTMLTDHFKLKWDPTAGVPEEVLAKVRAGSKVEAIKLYRELTGKGLRESHDLIEEIDRRIRFRL
ncbi:MAG TPA: hypothetical protein VKQ06_00615 [Gammaproteobacteria bacterium]|nr:hypothetical protein [Gammaproteobacteria bacterium]